MASPQTVHTGQPAGSRPVAFVLPFACTIPRLPRSGQLGQCSNRLASPNAEQPESCSSPSEILAARYFPLPAVIGHLQASVTACHLETTMPVKSPRLRPGALSRRRHARKLVEGSFDKVAKPCVPQNDGQRRNGHGTCDTPYQGFGIGANPSCTPTLAEPPPRTKLLMTPGPNPAPKLPAKRFNQGLLLRCPASVAPPVSKATSRVRSSAESHRRDRKSTR